MHARIEHLLSLRDRLPTEAWVADHVEQCQSCATELRRLDELRGRLQSLPQLEPPAVAWDRIRARSKSDSPPWQRRLRFAAAAVSLLVLGTVVAVIVRQNGITQHGPSIAVTGETPKPATADAAPVRDLVAQSQYLEGLLHSLPERPRIERVSTAATLDTIEQRIQWLDFQLSYAPEQGLSERQAQRLWRERVELMDSLVKVRSAEAGTISF